jgi:hypothetical protein
MSSKTGQGKKQGSSPLTFLFNVVLEVLVNEIANKRNNIILSEVSHAHKAKICRFSLICGI